MGCRWQLREPETIKRAAPEFVESLWTKFGGATFVLLLHDWLHAWLHDWLHDYYMSPTTT